MYYYYYYELRANRPRRGMRSSMGRETNKKKKARETHLVRAYLKTERQKRRATDTIYIIMNDISKSDIFPSDIPTGWALKVICSRLLFFLMYDSAHISLPERPTGVSNEPTR